MRAAIILVCTFFAAAARAVDSDAIVDFGLPATTKKQVCDWLTPVELPALPPAGYAPSTHADDLDVLVDFNVSVDARGKAYERLAAVEFSAIAVKLAGLLARPPVRPATLSAPIVLISGIGPQTKKPWIESRLNEEERIRYTLIQLWDHHLKEANPLGKNFPLLLDLLEVDGARYSAAHEISRRLYWGLSKATPDSSLPSVESVLARFERLARDPTQPNDLRREMVEKLFRFDRRHPNKYIDLLIEVCSAAGTLAKQADAFIHCTLIDGGSQVRSRELSKENLGKYLGYAFGLLEQGVDLAEHLDRFFAFSQPRVEFTPDAGLPKYWGDGWSKRYHQDTLDNALKWWKAHKAEYGADAARPGITPN